MLERLSQLPAREQSLLGFACLFIVALVADQVVVSPTLARLKAKDIEIAVAEEQLMHNRRVMELEDAVSTHYGQVRDLIGESSAPAEAIERLKGELDELASRTGLSLRAMQHLNPVATEFLLTYQIDVSAFSGETVSLLNFLHELHGAPGMLRVSRLTITSQEEDSAISGSMLITKVMTLGDEE